MRNTKGSYSLTVDVVENGVIVTTQKEEVGAMCVTNVFRGSAEFSEFISQWFEETINNQSEGLPPTHKRPKSRKKRNEINRLKVEAGEEVDDEDDTL